MNYSFEYIDIILLAMIVGFIFLRLRGILGKKTKHGEKISTNFTHEFIKERKNKGLISEATFVGINSADIKDYKQSNNIFEVTVKFVSEIISFVKDKDKKIISGDPDKIKKVHDTWKFSRDIRSSNPNWLLIDTQL